MGELPELTDDERAALSDGSLYVKAIMTIADRDAEIERLTRELSEKTGELEQLARGIQELDDIHRTEQQWSYADRDPYDGHWYVYIRGECNDDRHADSLLELVRKLGNDA